MFEPLCPDGGHSSVGRAPDCDSGCRGFNPRWSPQFFSDFSSESSGSTVLRFYGSGFSSLGVIAGTSWVSVTYLRHIVPILNSEDKLKYNNGMLIKLILASIVLVNLLSCSTNRKLDLPDKGNISSLDLSLLELAEDLKSEVPRSEFCFAKKYRNSKNLKI